MVHLKKITYVDLIDELKTSTVSRYSGTLNVTSSKGRRWSFYYRLGRIIWATGGIHPCRRWKRYMAQYCPQIDVAKLKSRPIDSSEEYWDYQLITNFYKKEELEPKEVDTVATEVISELLFDVAQQANYSQLSCDRDPSIVLDVPINFVNTSILLKRMEDDWNIWSSAGLASFSPDLAPAIKHPDELKTLVNPRVYQNFVNLLDNKNTLKDLSIILQREVRKVALDLQPFILKGLIHLSEIPDLPLPFQKKQRRKSAVPICSSEAPLIACIDDSPQVCEVMETIITSNRLRCLKIQDTIQALPLLIENKPDLIFLDLIMPVANGYEICAQIRRISSLEKTPIIILTGSDGLLDRVRAKVVGSTDFISKPVVPEKVMGTVNKYVNRESSAKSNHKKTSVVFS
ncbi:MAG: response regulator [Mastigocoleus sp.]